MSKKVHENFLMGLKVWWSWGSRFFFSKSPIVGRFSIFHAKLHVFAGLGALFGSFFGQFFVIFSCKTSVFCEAGCSFWVKKNSFFCKTSRFCGGGCSFWYLFLSIVCHFFMQNFCFLRGWEVFLSKKRHCFLGKTSVFEGLDALF